MKKLPFISSIPLSYIKSVIKIDPDSPSGLTWLPRQDIKFKFLNNHAGCKDTYKSGYQIWTTSINYNGKKYKLKCHRIVFLLHHGYLTKGKCIDHEDNNALNNNPDNLREGTKSQNNMNSKLPKNNTSGHKGVIWCKKKQKWSVQIKLNGKNYHFGYFVNKEDAIKVSIKARKKLHGKFGRK